MLSVEALSDGILVCYKNTIWLVALKCFCMQSPAWATSNESTPPCLAVATSSVPSLLFPFLESEAPQMLPSISSHLACVCWTSINSASSVVFSLKAFHNRVFFQGTGGHAGYRKRVLITFRSGHLSLD